MGWKEQSEQAALEQIHFKLSASAYAQTDEHMRLNLEVMTKYYMLKLGLDKQQIIISRV